VCVSHPPRSETVHEARSFDPRDVVIRRIQRAAARGAGRPERALAEIASILAAAGYDAADERLGRYLEQWWEAPEAQALSISNE
jgi:hypothetical protein